MFCNIDFKLIDKMKIFEREDDDPKFIVPVNAQLIVLANTDERFMNILNKNYTAFDGEVPLKFARKMKEYQSADAIKGSEVIYDFIDYSKENGLKIFLLGGKESSNTISVDKIRDKYGVEAAGYSPEFETYPFSNKFNILCMNQIEEFMPDVIFVGFGAPKQEFFIEDHYEEFKKIGVKYLIGCGGTFEFLSGNIKRAPKWVSRIGLESFYRLYQEMTVTRVMRILVSFKFIKYLREKPSFSKGIN